MNEFLKSVDWRWLFSGLGGAVFFFILGYVIFKPGQETKVDIDGFYKMEILPTGLDTRSAVGYCTIEQETGQSTFSLSGELGAISEVLQEGSDFDIRSQFAGIKGLNIYVIYVNQRKEEGIFKGTLKENSPSVFEVQYCDVSSNSTCETLCGEDLNNDPCGRIIFTKVNKPHS